MTVPGKRSCFIDWIMILPEALETQFDEAIFQYEKELRMQYVTSFERYGLKKGRQEGRQEGRLEISRESIVDILQVRFDVVSEAVVDHIHTIDDLCLLKQLHREAAIVSH